MPQIDKKSRILFYVLLFVICATVALTYYRTMVIHDYYIVVPVEEEQ